MTTGELHFEDNAAFDAFQRGLQDIYPDMCRDSLGNICGTIIIQAVDIADRVDQGEIDEHSARELARSGSAEIAQNCRYGLSETRKCGFGVLCALGVSE